MESGIEWEFKMLPSRVIYDHRQQTYFSRKKDLTHNCCGRKMYPGMQPLNVYIQHSLLSITVCLIKGKNKQLLISFGDINVKALEQRKAATLYQIRI